MKRSSLFLFSSLFLLAGSHAWAAACCGGGVASPSLIAGDHRAQLGTSLSHTEILVHSVDTKGDWHRWRQRQQVQVLRLEGAQLLSDRSQAGFSLPVFHRIRDAENSSGLGDVSTSWGYEYLTDWDYHPWRPRGVGYLQVVLPTGRSKAESELGGLDSRGNGFWAVGAGTLLTKTWGRWDALASLDAHRSFGKSISTSQIQGTLKPGWGGNLGLGAGYNTKSLRWGGQITWTYEDPIGLDGPSSSSGSLERYATALASLSYMPNPEWSATLGYSDQTLFGSPLNTSLGRGLQLQLQRKWER
ncbi:MAG: serine protease spb1 [Bdellovibrionaceae bacterium]|nr:serine protease spb1 [Pseudobdellovibrionaceae bacterium]